MSMCKWLDKLNNWLDKGAGCEWYEPYVTNRDTIRMIFVTITLCSIIILGFVLINHVYPNGYMNRIEKWNIY